MPKISALAATATLVGTELVPVVQAGTTERTTVQAIANLATGGTGTRDVVSPFDYGAVADGASHPLANYYGTLAEAQAVYSFATSLAQEIDYCACKKASNIAFGADAVIPAGTGDPGNGVYVPMTALISQSEIEDTTQNWVVNEHAGKSLYIKFTSSPTFQSSWQILSNTAHTITLVSNYPFTLNPTVLYAIGAAEHGAAGATLNKAIDLGSGRYRFGNDTWLIRNLVSGLIYGRGRLATVLTGNDIVLGFDGIWYSELANFSILVQTTGAATGLDLDGNVPTGPYTTRGVQGVTCRNLLIDGGGSSTACYMTRQGQSTGQGSECLFLNCHFSNASFACYAQVGFNALSNSFIGGNFQTYTKHGVYVSGGTVGLFNCGFQSTTKYIQVQNGGYDIQVGDSGAYETVVVYGCRTESLRFLKNDGAVRTDIRGVVGRPAMSTWFANTSYGPSAALGKAIMATAADNNVRLFVATTPGTSGGTEPAWPANGTPVNDGTIVWQEELLYFVNVAGQTGSIDYETVVPGCGFIIGPEKNYVITKAANYTMFSGEDEVSVDASAGPVTITTPYSYSFGRTVTIKKVDTTANAVTVNFQTAFELTGTTDTITAPRSAKTYIYANIATGGPPTWQIVSTANIIRGNIATLDDGVTAPSATSGQAKIYVDAADGDLKVIFGDGVVKTIVVDT